MAKHRKKPHCAKGRVKSGPRKGRCKLKRTRRRRR